ncbi:MAG: glycerophosphodiester phosphodiesterase [Halobellus sp.]|uniref:glycerophosphodiester phosphodiesterase n=1 Tax=Halobellus sp. TaxID=1979212 RepID=UPI0035D42EEA
MGTTDGSPTDDSATDGPAGDVALIAHRGCAAQYPENTVLSATRAAPHVEIIEIDVQRCGSGELVVFHDDELDRLTGASGPVAETDWATLQTLTVADSGEPIPRLEPFLDAVPDDTAVNVELKHDGMAADVDSAVDGVKNDLLFSSFDADALRELRAAIPTASLGYLFFDEPGLAVSIATSLDCIAVHPSVNLVFSTDIVDAAHAAGLDVNVWTVDDTRIATDLIAAGVDGLIVDRWDLLDADE